MNWQSIVQQNNLCVSEVNLSLILDKNRLDAEYYQPDYLSSDKKLDEVGYYFIESFASITDGIHTSIDFDEDSKINLISAMSPKENFFDISKNKTISEKQNTSNPRTQLRKNDVIVSTVGTIGNCAVVDETILPANSDRHVGIIRLKDGFYPHFVSTFLLSKYGRFQTIRESTGNVQLNLFIEKIRKIKVLKASNGFQSLVDDTVLKALNKRQGAMLVYAEAERLLLADLNLAHYIPSDTNTSTRKLSDCLADDRFDAEYWQPKYDDITQAIKSYRSGFDTFDNLFVIGNQTAINPDETYSYVELADVDSSLGTIENYTEMQGKELPSRGRMPLRKDDVIMSSLDGSLNKTALVTIDKQNTIGSTGFFVMRKKYFEPEVALVLLKSKPIQDIVGRQAQGTILTAIPKTSLSRIILPKIANDTQVKIKSLVMDAHKKKAIAQLTLEKAKRAIEIFVEKDEESALSYLSQI